ncbi:MAG: ATP-binding protein [Pseudomonadota bacterium]|nr:ATP-binding protein [Pseudomonadota bacterium]
MRIDLFSRFKVTFFIKLMIVSSIVAVVGLLIFPGSAFSFGFSLAVHTLLVVALFWFMVKIVWPIRASLDKIVFFVEKHKVNSDEDVSRRSEIVMGSYRGILDNVVNLMENQYEDLISHSRQLEIFSQVLEKQNLKVNESRQRYRRTLDALENGLFLIDDSYIIQSINRAEAAYFEAVPKELVGKKCYQVFRQRKSPCPDCMPRDCMADGQSRNRLRVERRRLGREYVNIYCYPIFHKGEESHEAVIHIQDVSPLVMMEEQVLRTEKMASIGQMAAGIAHDLNNYLAAIYGVVQLLQMRFEMVPAEHEKDLKLLGRLREQVEALNLMAGNLMVFSHPERKELFPLPLNQVIDDALSFSRYELEREQVGVNKKFAEGLPSGRMEKGQIQQVVLNLMLNAAQAIRERKAQLEDGFIGQVRVTTGLEDEKHIFFSVIDNGAGITPECQEHLFDPFFSTKEVKVEGGATGLGLFTAQTIVKQHQGTISFSSEIGKGSSFKVVLPLRQDDDLCIL